VRSVAAVYVCLSVSSLLLEPDKPLAFDIHLCIAACVQGLIIARRSLKLLLCTPSCQCKNSCLALPFAKEAETETETRGHSRSSVLNARATRASIDGCSSGFHRLRASAARRAAWRAVQSQARVGVATLSV